MTDIATREAAREIPIASELVTRAAAKGSGQATSTRAPGSIEVYREDFEKQSAAPATPATPAWLQNLRQMGMARFEALGYPTTKNEDWHFTSVAPIAERTFRLSTLHSASSLGLKAADLERFGFGQADWHRLVFINGVFDESLSSFEDGGDAVSVGSLADAINSGSPAIQRHLGTIAKFEQHTFTALNTAFISDGAFIELANDTVVEQPIHLLFISGGEGVCHPRNLIVAGRHSRAAVIESYVSLRDSEYFSNPVTEIVAGEGAHIDHYKLQRESESAFHVGTVQIREERDSQLHSFSFAVGGALARTNVYTSLEGDGATCTLNGLYLTDGTQHIDNQTSIEHIAPNCPSHEVYKGVLDGRSHGVFNGKVYVHPEAQKTDGKQSNNNLLLSPSARVDTKPQLEIFADDVKCTHGATVGRLDELAMFYLNSRGIGRETARTLLTYAFAADVLETIELEPLKKELEKMVLARFTDTPAG